MLHSAAAVMAYSGVRLSPKERRIPDSRLNPMTRVMPLKMMRRYSQVRSMVFAGERRSTSAG